MIKELLQFDIKVTLKKATVRSTSEGYDHGFTYAEFHAFISLHEMSYRSFCRNTHIFSTDCTVGSSDVYGFCGAVHNIHKIEMMVDKEE